MKGTSIFHFLKKIEAPQDASKEVGRKLPNEKYINNRVVNNGWKI